MSKLTYKKHHQCKLQVMTTTGASYVSVKSIVMSKYIAESINQTTDCRVFRPRMPSSTAYKTVLYAVALCLSVISALTTITIRSSGRFLKEPQKFHMIHTLCDYTNITNIFTTNLQYILYRSAGIQATGYIFVWDLYANNFVF